MAGDWIKMRKTLPADPRIVRIMSALKADRFRTLGGVLSAWCLFDDQTEDGTLDGYTPEVFDEMVGFPGLAKAMASVGWLEIGDDFLAAPRFSEHNGQSAKRRSQENARKMSARNADKLQTESALEKRRDREEKNTNKKTTGDFAKCAYLDNPEFAEVFEQFKASSRSNHHWTIAESTAQVWLFELTRHPIDEAIEILRFSTGAGTKKPIMNGDHKKDSSTRKAAGSKSTREMEIVRD